MDGWYISAWNLLFCTFEWNHFMHLYFDKISEVGWFSSRKDSSLPSIIHKSFSHFHFLLEVLPKRDADFDISPQPF